MTLDIRHKYLNDVLLAPHVTWTLSCDEQKMRMKLSNSFTCRTTIERLKDCLEMHSGSMFFN